MFVLITSYFISANDQRQQEINECLLQNTKNPWIHKIYLLNDRYYPLDFILENGDKIQQVVLPDGYKNNRLLYSTAIQFANTHLSPDDVCILSNSDIYFDDSLGLLLSYNLENKFLALSRYDNQVLFDRHDSQDTWIFRCPFFMNIDPQEINFQFGMPGCDNRIAKIALDHGYLVSNPSRSIRTHHLHASNHRTYTSVDRIQGEYHFIPSTTLD
jgi:hypothetical protein